MCCFLIFLPLDLLADVQGEGFLPSAAALPRAWAAERVRRWPRGCERCRPAVAGLGVPAGALPSITCTEPVMLCTEPGTVVTTLFFFLDII